MITYADDEQYFYQIQAIIDLDFENRISIERINVIPDDDPWYLR